MKLSAKNSTLKVLFFCLMVLLAGRTLSAQSAAINTDGSSADPSAALDIKSTTRGLLIPRMSNADRTALILPAPSLVIFQNDGVPGYYYNSGTAGAPVWVQLLPANGNGSLLTNLNAAALASGIVPTARLGSGVASSSTFLRGDSTWAPISGILSGTLNFIPKFTPNGSTLGNSLLLDDGNNVGVGDPAPAYRLDVLHGGSTGIRSRSSSSFSVVDIDAQSGDAALRFQRAGVNQWNIRNRPADDYLEIFELGGGGSRMVIQDATGNVGIGETTNPAYRLDVLHGGSTGIRSRSSSSFSVVDIDAASGDAALRFAKAGVNQWNVRNRPADDYFEIFELGGGGSRMVIQDATGNVGIGQTTNPTYKLDVLHGGATGLRVQSSSTFSVIDIDGQNGDAALRFVKAGVNQWNTRNNPGNDDYQIFELGGGGERLRIENTTGKVVVNGDFTAVGVKAFTMDHPLDPENKTLMHAAVESNEVLNSYSGNVVTDANGRASVELPDYFEAINKDFRYQLTVVGGMFAQAMISKEVNGNKFEIATSQPNVKVSWEVKGVRNDARMQKNPFTAVQEKPAAQKGKYIDPASHNLPASKGVSYDPNIEGGRSSVSDVAPAPKSTKEIQTKGGSLEQPAITAPKAKAVDTSGSVRP